MKKTLLIALVGFMFVAFASCGGGTKQYKDLCKALDQIEDIMDDATTCSDLERADAIDLPDGANYSKEDLMTEDETQKITERYLKILGEYSEKASELCGDVFGGGYDDYGYDYDDDDYDDDDYDF